MRNVALTAAAASGLAVAAQPDSFDWKQLLWPVLSAILAVVVEWVRRKAVAPPQNDDGGGS